MGMKFIGSIAKPNERNRIAFFDFNDFLFEINSFETTNTKKQTTIVK
jgi:hypothetical protein